MSFLGHWGKTSLSLVPAGATKFIYVIVYKIKSNYTSLNVVIWVIILIKRIYTSSCAVLGQGKTSIFLHIQDKGYGYVGINKSFK